MIYRVIPTRLICADLPANLSHKNGWRIHVKFNFAMKQNAYVFKYKAGVLIHKWNRAYNGLRTAFTYSGNTLTCECRLITFERM